MTDQDYIAEHAAQCDADEREFHEAGLRALGKPKPMTAAECLRQPGDVARRESDGAVAVWMYEFGADPPRIVVMKPHDRSWWPPGQAIPGDDWQPLHPAGDGDWMARAYGAESVAKCEQQKNAELAAEVKRLTADRDKYCGELRESAERNARLIEETHALTARVAELESGSAFVGEELRSRPERDEHYGFYWAQSSRGGPELELSHTGEASIPECHDWVRAFAYTGPTTAPIPSPLPTAGDEGKAGKGWRRVVAVNGSRRGWASPKGQLLGVQWDGRESIDMGCEESDLIPEEAFDAPAEPDSPAEGPAKPSGVGERIHKAALDEPCWMHRDGEWTEAKFDPFCPHPQYRRAAEHRKPSCLDGVPAVLCEHEYKRKVWAYGPISDGWMACWVVDQQRDCERHVELIAAEFLTPIHHDAAAVELRGRIERGGGNAQ